MQAGLDGLIAVGTTALSFTGIPAWGMGLVGAATGFGQYAMDAGFHNQQLTWAGSITSTVLGGVFGLVGGPGSRNPGAIIDNMVGLSDDGVRAINAITNAANRRVLGEISEKGMQATLNLYGRTAFNAVQAAIPGTIRHLMIKGIAPGIYLPLINAGLSIGLDYLYQWLGWC